MATVPFNVPTPSSVSPTNGATIGYDPSGQGAVVGSAYRWVAAWTVLLVLLWAMNKSRIGHVVIYYTLVLMIVFLLLTQYQSIKMVLLPVTTLSGETGPHVAAVGDTTPPAAGRPTASSNGANLDTAVQTAV